MLLHFLLRISIVQTGILLFVYSLCTYLPLNAHVLSDTTHQEISRMNKLYGLCKLWGAVKYFHPATTFSLTAWDSALVQSLPRVENARTVLEYTEALNYLLSFLYDPSTQVLNGSINSLQQKQGYTIPDIESKSSLYWTNDSLAIFSTSYSLSNTPSVRATTLDYALQMQKSKGVIWDLRGHYTTDTLNKERINTIRTIIESVLNHILPSSIELPRFRFRHHTRYCPQTTYDFVAIKSPYNCQVEFFEQRNEILKSKKIFPSIPPLVILVNQYSLGIEDILIGLQTHCGAIVIQDGHHTIPLYGQTAMIHLPMNIKAQIRTSEYIAQNGVCGLHPNYIYSKPSTLDDTSTVVAGISPKSTLGVTAVALQMLRKEIPLLHQIKPQYNVPENTTENPYKLMLNPSKEYRLLSLFRLWNIIHYFYPYKDIAGTPWDSVFSMFLPKFEMAKDSIQYANTVSEILAELHDSHINVEYQLFADYWGIARGRVGNNYLPLVLQCIEDKTIITYTYGDIPKQLGLQVGDIITHFNGIPVKEYCRQLARTQSFSTPQAETEWTHRIGMISGSRRDTAHIHIVSAKGTHLDVALAYSLSTFPFRPLSKYRTVGIVQSKNLGYIDLTTLTQNTIDSAFGVVKNTRGLILDMRGYPQQTMYKVASRITEKKALAAQFRQPLLNAASITLDNDKFLHHIFEQYIEPDTNRVRYTQKIVVLINSATMSQAEHMCLFLEAATNVTFVGSSTVGADGTVTSAVLPGGISFTFTGQEVRHADGRQLQRIGIQPHVFAAPTIAGIRAGRDEVLEKGVEVLQTLIKQNSTPAKSSPRK